MVISFWHVKYWVEWAYRINKEKENPKTETKIYWSTKLNKWKVFSLDILMVLRQKFYKWQLLYFLNTFFNTNLLLRTLKSLKIQKNKQFIVQKEVWWIYVWVEKKVNKYDFSIFSHLPNNLSETKDKRRTKNWE